MNFQIIPAPNDYEHPSDAASHVFGMGDPVITSIPAYGRGVIIAIRDHYLNRAGERVDLPEYRVHFDNPIPGSPVVWFFGYQLRKWEPKFKTPPMVPAVPGNPDSPALVWVLFVDGVKWLLPNKDYCIGVFTDRVALDQYMKSLPDDPLWKDRIGELRVEEHQLNNGLLGLTPKDWGENSNQ